MHGLASVAVESGMYASVMAAQVDISMSFIKRYLTIGRRFLADSPHKVHLPYTLQTNFILCVAQFVPGDSFLHTLDK